MFRICTFCRQFKESRKRTISSKQCRSRQPAEWIETGRTNCSMWALCDRPLLWAQSDLSLLLLQEHPPLALVSFSLSSPLADLWSVATLSPNRFCLSLLSVLPNSLSRVCCRFPLPIRPSSSSSPRLSQSMPSTGSLIHLLSFPWFHQFQALSWVSRSTPSQSLEGPRYY